MIEIEIGRAKRGRRAYSLDDVAVVPSRRTRDPEEVSLGWQIDAYHFDVPVLAAPMDSVMSPETAIAFGRLGGLPVLDLEGLWTRYEDPAPVLEEIASLPQEDATVRMREIYARDIRPELIVERVRAVREAGITVAGALSPQRTQQHWKTVVDSGVDLFVIRGTTVSAEHVSSRAEPLNLKRFIYELDVPVVVGGVTTYTAALHLMRTGAAGVLVGQGGGASSSVRQVLGLHMPMATAVADVAGARRLQEAAEKTRETALAAHATASEAHRHLEEALEAVDRAAVRLADILAGSRALTQVAALVTGRNDASTPLATWVLLDRFAETAGRTARRLGETLGRERDQMQTLSVQLDSQSVGVLDAVERQSRMVVDASDLAQTQLREAEAFGVLDHHHGGIRHVHTHLDHRCGD